MAKPNRSWEIRKAQMNLLAKLIFVAFSLVVTQTSIASVQLGSTDISFTASGSPNTIVGSWSALPLDIPTNDTVDYYMLEIIQAESPFGLPTGLTFGGKLGQLSFGAICPIFNSCVGHPNTGDITVLNVADAAQNQQPALNFLVNLDPDNAFFANSGVASVFFNSGGNQTTAFGSVRVTAFGTSSDVPEPETSVLVLVGLTLVGVMTRKRKLLRAY